MEQKVLEKYAQLLVKKGINIQKNQILVINCPVECAEFARVITKIAYDEGAKEVFINWSDEIITQLRYLHATDEVFDEYPEWMKVFYLNNAEKDAAFLSISATNPELLKDVDSNRITRYQKVSSKAIEEYRNKQMSNKLTWCIASIPTTSWAKKVFPNVSDEKAKEKLWDAIIKTVRVDQDDPKIAWDEHLKNLNKSSKSLNESHFKMLKFHNKLGTDLSIELPEGHIWLGGAEITPNGIVFIANIPTEEVFTLPKKTGVNGIVYSSKPLNYNGNLIEDFSITFKEGKIVDFKAKTGYETLQSLIETDEGSHYLGEVALVSYDSPISKSNILFFNTLFDENASCHLAIGRAYPVCIKNSEGKDAEELNKMGVNNSSTHVDFMFGTKDLQIIGITHDNKEVAIFKDGNFII
ncbi:MAG: peptidase [Haloplasmataceae bacterium]|nr:peptidase [Haloplasmataceae bacterium]